MNGGQDSDLRDSLLDRSPASRVVHRAIFPAACDFQVHIRVGDVVLTPRSSGGFRFAQVKTITTPVGLTVTSISLGPQDAALVRVDQGSSIKELPHYQIGILKHGVLASSSSSQDGEGSDVTPVLASSTPCQDSTTSGDSTERRVLAGPACDSDIAKVTFSRRSPFTPTQVVLVPSARGGLVYGRIDTVDDLVSVSTSQDGRTARFRRQCVGYLGDDIQLTSTLTHTRHGSRHSSRGSGGGGKQHQRGGTGSSSSIPTPSRQSTPVVMTPSAIVKRDEYEAETDEIILYQPLNAPTPSAQEQEGKKEGELGSYSRTIDHVPPVVQSTRPPVVIDGPNVGCTFGKGKLLDALGIVVACNYWKQRGYPVVVFVPAYYVDTRAYHPDALHCIPECDLPLIQPLLDSGELVLTPSQDYDDSYTIQYARTAQGYILSNDRFRDHEAPVEAGDGNGGGDGVHDGQPASTPPPPPLPPATTTSSNDDGTWQLSSRVISYAFVHGELLPNPDFTMG